MSEIHWPERYFPGTTDNFVSKQVIIADPASARVWPNLNDTTPKPPFGRLFCGRSRPSARETKLGLGSQAMTSHRVFPRLSNLSHNC
jgi:hypothetical protein